MSKKNDNLDFLDELFDQLETNGAQTVNDFGSMIKQRVNDEMKKNGYDNFSDMIFGSSDTYAQGKAKNRTVVRDVESRTAYFISALSNVTYGYQYRGYYREAHQEALDRYIAMAQSNPTDLSALEKSVSREIRMVHQSHHRASDKEYQGYLDGLKMVKKALENSKIYMMGKIAEKIV